MAYNPAGLPITYAQPGARWIDRKHKKPRVLWRPLHPEDTPMSRYRQHVNRNFQLELKDSHDLHEWSVKNPHDFWTDLYNYTGITPSLPSGTRNAYNPSARFSDIPTWFEGHKLNFAENLLLPNVERDPAAVALTGLRESQLDDPEQITWCELYELVRITQNALIDQGVKENDVIAALMSNSIWIIVAFLATSSIGAIFTSIAPDMGLSGCLSRLSQVSPKLLFTEIDYASRGSRLSLIPKVKDILNGLPASQTRPKTIFIPTTHAPHRNKNFSIPTELGITLYDFLAPTGASADPLTFTRLPTSHPLVILYSSGTTGPPKCIVSPHISLLNYRKIALLHNSLSPSSTVFQYSSTSWILWNVMLGHFSVGAHLITFDGNPLFPDAGTPLEICETYGVTYWGTSPRYLLELEQQVASGKVRKNFNLDKLKMVTTTGAPLLTSQMGWFYSPLFPARMGNVHLSSVAGGTDIASSWIASDPAGPVYEGEMQMWALGHDCVVLSQDPKTTSRMYWDAATKTRKQVRLQSWQETNGEPGELVCKKPIPSAPVYFWGDDRKKSKYMEAYFRRFPTSIDAKTGDVQDYLDVWAQHDLTTRNPATGGLQISGRSDTTLNPSGIRFGSSEIYHVVEAPPLNKEISDCLCVGRRRKGDSDEVVFLFLIPAKGVVVDEDLVGRVKDAIRINLSPRHVPKFVFEVKEIPYTVNGKKVENVVKKIISGVDVTPSSTITNPECLEQYRRYKHVERDTTSKSRL